MRKSKFRYSGTLAVAVVALLAISADRLSSQQSVGVQIDNDDIGGIVTSAKVRRRACG